MTDGAIRAGARVFGPSRAKMGFMAAVFFTAASACYSASHGDNPRSVMIWILCGVLCVMAILAAVSSICGYPRLTMDTRGLEFATLFNTTRYDWNDLEDICLAHIAGWRVIGLRYSPEYRGWRGARFCSRHTVGLEGIFPGVFSVSLGKICHEMRRYLRRDDVSTNPTTP